MKGSCPPRPALKRHNQKISCICTYIAFYIFKNNKEYLGISKSIRSKNLKNLDKKTGDLVAEGPLGVHGSKYP